MLFAVERSRYMGAEIIEEFNTSDMSRSQSCDSEELGH